MYSSVNPKAAIARPARPGQDGPWEGSHLGGLVTQYSRLYE